MTEVETSTATAAARSVEPVLRVRDLTVSFHGAERTVHAVDGVSYELAPGEVLAVVGESGCGKSVTSMAVMGLLPPTARIGGSITLDGQELVGAPEKRLRSLRGRRLSMIFQEPMTSLNPVLTIGRQITEVLRRHQGLGRSEARSGPSNWSASSASPPRTSGSTSTRTSCPAGCGSA